jgi:hypothetical protein
MPSSFISKQRSSSLRVLTDVQETIFSNSTYGYRMQGQDGVHMIPVTHHREHHGKKEGGEKDDAGRGSRTLTCFTPVVGAPQAEGRPVALVGDGIPLSPTWKKFTHSIRVRVTLHHTALANVWQATDHTTTCCPVLFQFLLQQERRCTILPVMLLPQ